ncbi:MAG: hypothetical protein O2955_22225 [Planctomycetota bacterium]|nr:hypothetical protein [Planctomycetota bacterium]MDA1215225.1 hypothetical protein [Planctomycetota bacterium]
MLTRLKVRAKKIFISAVSYSLLLTAFCTIVAQSSDEQSTPSKKVKSFTADADDAESEVKRLKLKKELFHGEVMLLSEALKLKGVKSFSEQNDQAVLVTPEKELIPIVSDWRGRAFFQDERLRNRQVELVGTRRPGVPYLQVLGIYTFDEEGTRMHTDYWCDICSIPMYEIKPCDCCQMEIRLRFLPQDLPDYLSQESH